ncbi:MAG: type 1 glutamine amidotransferase [Planctomycetota bacterium]
MPSIPVLRHVSHETLGTIADALNRAGLCFHYLDLFEPRIPQGPIRQLDLSDAPGLIVMGGPMNVDEVDKFPHLADEVQWIRDALDRQLPVLGVCLGSQLLAKAAGARVFPNGVKEIGWYDLQLTPEAATDPLFGGCGPQLRVFQWHGDTFELPADAAHLAYSGFCQHQAFRLGDRAWGLQFHIEVTGEMIDDWLCEPGNCCELESLDYIDPATIRAQMPSELPAMETLAARVFDRFATLCGAARAAAPRSLP